MFSFQFSKWSKASGLTSDTRKVQKDFIFFLPSRVSCKKAKLYVEQALDKGALCAVHGVPSLGVGTYVAEVDLMYSQALQNWYRDSFDHLKIYGVTGTNGKTTTCFMLKKMLELYKVETGVFGTTGNFYKSNVLNTGLTSPSAEDFYAFNHENFLNGMRAVVCEVSSHALDQNRLGCHFLSGAAWTSFSQDHLDYHGSMETYLHAKKKIFTHALKKEAVFVSLESLDHKCGFEFRPKHLLGGKKYQSKFRLIEEGVEVTFAKKGHVLTGVLPLPGIYNGENFTLALMLLCEHFGGEFFPDQRVFQDFKFAPGRMEKITLSNGSQVFVDYSHTPDALEQALKALPKGLKKVVVFGCGGERDQLKRPLMAEVAERFSNHVFVTNDNPRKEAPDAIVQDILKGFSKEVVGIKVQVVLDRGSAIEQALQLALKEKSVVLVAGKGHENTQDINGKKIKFSDQETVNNWVKKNE